MNFQQKSFIVPFLGLFFIFAGISTFIVYTQTKDNVKDRSITNTPFSNQPVEVSSLKIFGESHNFSSPFNADEDWIKNLSIDIKNTSDKNIIFLEVGLDFPMNDSPVGDIQRENYRIPLRFGREPNLKIDLDTKQKLVPSETITLTIKESFVNRFNKTLAQKGSGKALEKSNATLTVTKVHYDDKTFWAGGVLFKWDDTTQRFVRIGKPKPNISKLEKSDKIQSLNFSGCLRNK